MRTWHSFYVALVVAFWILMMGSLFYREVTKSRAMIVEEDSPLAPEAIARSWRDYSEYALVMWQGVTVGAMATSITREQLPTPHYLLQMCLEAWPRMPLGSNRMRVVAVADLDPNLALQRFRMIAHLLGNEFELNGLVYAGRELLLELQRAKERTRLRFALQRPISLAEAIRPLALRKTEIRKGATFQVPVVDPLWSMQIGTLEVSIGDVETLHLPQGDVQAWRVESRLNEFVSTSWVDAAGRPVRSQLIGALWLDRTSAEKAREIAPGLATALDFVKLDSRDFGALPLRSLSAFPTALSNSVWVQGAFSRR